MKIDPPFELDPNVKVRTRFAPSPTGYLHVGGARTALYSWLFAKHNNGEFVLRIEDTDLERSTPEATAAIIEGMEWLNLAWEHGPYYQTKRFDRYNQVIDEMIEQGLAYRCYCSKERLEELRHTQEQNKEAYERFVKAIAEGRHLSEDEVKKLADGRTYTGTQAVANKLADKVGTEDELIDLIKEEKGLSNPTVIELRADKTAESLISRFVKATTKSFISELNSEVNSNKVERSYLG